MHTLALASLQKVGSYATSLPADKQSVCYYSLEAGMNASSATPELLHATSASSRMLLLQPRPCVSFIRPQKFQHCCAASGHPELRVWPHHNNSTEAARHGVCGVGLQAC